jgi:hypothetical protein
MKKIGIILTLACHLLWLSGTGWSQLRPAQAHIVFLKGKVEVQRPGSAPQPAALSSEVSIGDRLISHEDSEVEIRLPDGSVLKMKDKGLMEIGDLKNQSRPMASLVSLKLTWGKLLGCVKKLSARESKFEVATPTAVAGIRGTVFAVFAEGDSTELDVLAGQVAVTGEKGTERLIGEKQYTIIAKGDSARSPLPMTAAKIAFITAWAGAALKLGSIGAAGAKAWYATTPALIGGGVVAAAVAAAVIIASGGGGDNPPPGGGAGPTIGRPPTLPSP